MNAIRGFVYMRACKRESLLSRNCVTVLLDYVVIKKIGAAMVVCNGSDFLSN